MEYAFKLIYKLDISDNHQDEIIERLGMAECTDALVGTGVPGRIALDFIREANSAKEALLSAMADLKRVIPSAQLIEVGPDFVGLTDIADVIKVSRQNIRKLVAGHSTFPMPIHSGTSAIYHLSEVLGWFKSKGGYSLDSEMLDLAKTTQQINWVRSAQLVEVDLGFARQLKSLMA